MGSSAAPLARAGCADSHHFSTSLRTKFVVLSFKCRDSLWCLQNLLWPVVQYGVARCQLWDGFIDII